MKKFQLEIHRYKRFSNWWDLKILGCLLSTCCLAEALDTTSRQWGQVNINARTLPFSYGRSMKSALQC
jgi:hypothetical protein